MEGITTAFWSMTINNYDENDLALVRNGYADYMREIVHTLEKGKDGTPHIQAWVKLQRQQRMSFIKKLFPRGHFKALTSDEYKHNTKCYAQKSDETTQSPSVHKFHDPMNTIESVVKKVCLRIIEEAEDSEDLTKSRIICEKLMATEDYRMAKIFVSASYKSMWREFGHEIFQCLYNQHTHTHTHSENLISREGGITNENQDQQAQVQPNTTQEPCECVEGQGICPHHDPE